MSKKFCSDDIIFNDEELNSKYLFKKKIGTGCFGKVFQVINLITRQISALKVQFTDLDNQTTDYRFNLDIQYSILKRLKNVQGVPKIYAIGRWQKGKYLEMELLQSDFSILTNESTDISKEEIQKIGSKYLNLFKQIHEEGIIHRDLKPQNMMENHYGQIYMIDFGISKVYSNKKSIEKKRGFVGTPRYASISAHTGCDQGPKDDIQSLFYVLAHFYFKILPWMKLPQTPSRMEQIMKLKLQKADAMFMKLGTNFFKCFRYIRELKHGQKVNYKFMINILQNIKPKTFIHENPKLRKQQKKLSLPLAFNNDQNRILQRDRKYSVSTARQIISLNKSTNSTVGTIVINWVNKQSIVPDQIKQESNESGSGEISILKKSSKKNKILSINKNTQYQKESKHTNKAKNQSQRCQSCFDSKQFDENIQQNQPKIRTAQRFKTSLNPFINNA